MCEVCVMKQDHAIINPLIWDKHDYLSGASASWVIIPIFLLLERDQRYQATLFLESKKLLIKAEHKLTIVNLRKCSPYLAELFLGMFHPKLVILCSLLIRRLCRPRRIFCERNDPRWLSCCVRCAPARNYIYWPTDPIYAEAPYEFLFVSTVDSVFWLNFRYFFWTGLCDSVDWQKKLNSPLQALFCVRKELLEAFPSRIYSCSCLYFAKN